MNSSNSNFNRLARQAAKSGIESSDERNKPAGTRFALAILGLLLYVGAEGFRVVLRKNIGLNGLDLLRAILCSLSFLGVAVYSFFLITTPENFTLSDNSSDSYFVTAVLSFSIAVLVLAKAISHRRKAKERNDHSGYQGDSSILAGRNTQLVQNLAEPFLVLAIGGIYSFYNLLGGIPIMACAVSYWLYLLLEMFFSADTLEKRADALNSRFNKEDEFYEVK